MKSDQQQYLPISNNNHCQIAPEQILSSNNNTLRVYRQHPQISAQIFQLSSNGPCYNENNYPTQMGQPVEQGSEGYRGSQYGMIIDIQLKALSQNFTVALMIFGVNV